MATLAGLEPAAYRLPHQCANVSGVPCSPWREIDVPKKTTPEADAAAQSARFIEAARELGCDESPGAFEAAVKKVARHKPVEEKPPIKLGKAKADDVN